MINFKSAIAGIICFLFSQVLLAVVLPTLYESGPLALIIGILGFIGGFWMYKRSQPEPPSDPV